MPSKNIYPSTHFLAWLLLASIVCIIMSQLVQNGNFLDGTLYTAVGRNLAEGRGTFWETHLTTTLMPSYHEQPPLYFGLLAIFYKIFGTSYLVERFFSAICFAAASYFIIKIWLLVYKKDGEAKEFAWLPVLIFALFPVVFWAYTNMASEVLMTPFVLASVFFILKYHEIRPSYPKIPLLDLIFAAFFIFCASLTKGLQGTFSLIAPLLYVVTTEGVISKKAIQQVALLLGTVALIYGVLLWSDEAVYTSFERYFHDRLVATFSNKPDIAQPHYFLLIVLCNEFIAAFLLCGFAFHYYSKNKKPKIFQNRLSQYQEFVVHNHAKFFLLLAASGTLPLLITAEQRNFYLTTAMPYFALAFAIYLQPAAAAFLAYCQSFSDKKRIFNTFPRTIFIVVFCASFIFMLSCIGKTKCNNDLLADVYLLQKKMPNSVVTIPKELWSDFEIHAYLSRYCNISLDTTEPHTYFMIKKDIPPTLVPDNYKKMDFDTKFLDVYKNQQKVLQKSDY